MDYSIIYGISAVINLVVAIFIFIEVIDYPIPGENSIFFVLMAIFCPIFNTLLTLYCIFAWLGLFSENDNEQD